MSLHFLARYKFHSLFFLLVAVGLTAIFLIRMGHYPILLVDNSFVSARTFWKVYHSATVYYGNALKTYTKDGAGQTVLSSKDIEASVLTQLVEDVLVYKEVNRELGNDLNSLVQNKITRYVNDSQLQAAAEAVYGIPFRDIQYEILVPQAKRDILSGRLFLKSESFEKWLRDAKAQSRVTIFSSGFEWDGQKIVPRH